MHRQHHMCGGVAKCAKRICGVIDTVVVVPLCVVVTGCM